jgi:hypothetical protein
MGAPTAGVTLDRKSPYANEVYRTLAYVGPAGSEETLLELLWGDFKAMWLYSPNDAILWWRLETRVELERDVVDFKQMLRMRTRVAVYRCRWNKVFGVVDAGEPAHEICA